MNKTNMLRVQCTVPAEEVVRLKSMGCLRDTTTPDCFNVRIVTCRGVITAKQARALADAAERFGNGKIAMTSRLSAEIQSVSYAKVADMLAFLAPFDLEAGGTGPKVRPVVSCKGTTCQYGLIDTFALAEEIHHRFYKGYRDVKLPHKFKIAVGGCPNNCVKPDLNDFGVIGQRIVAHRSERCRGCAKCQLEASCPIKICKMDGGKVVVDTEQCIHCGRCLEKCPFGVADEYEQGYAVYIGGRWGKKTARGRRLGRVFISSAEVLEVLEKSLSFYREQGIPGERFADTIERIGFDQVERYLVSNDE